MIVRQGLGVGWNTSAHSQLVRTLSHSPHLREAGKRGRVCPGRETGFDEYIAKPWSHHLISIHSPFNNSLAFYTRYCSRLWGIAKT